MRYVIQAYIQDRSYETMKFDDWEVKQYQRDTVNILGHGPHCLVCENQTTGQKIEIDLVGGILEMHLKTPEAKNILDVIPAGGEHLTSAEDLPKDNEVKQKGFLIRSSARTKTHEIYRLDPDFYRHVNYIFPTGIDSELMVLGIQMSCNMGTVLDDFLSKKFQEGINLKSFGLNTERMCVLTLELGKNNNRLVMWPANSVETLYDEMIQSIKNLSELFQWPEKLTQMLSNMVLAAKQEFFDAEQKLRALSHDERIAGLWKLLDVDYPDPWIKSDYFNMMSFFEKEKQDQVAADMKLVLDEYKTKLDSHDFYNPYRPHPDIERAMNAAKLKVLHKIPYSNTTPETTINHNNQLMFSHKNKNIHRHLRASLGMAIREIEGDYGYTLMEFKTGKDRTLIEISSPTERYVLRDASMDILLRIEIDNNMPVHKGDELKLFCEEMLRSGLRFSIICSDIRSEDCFVPTYGRVVICATIFKESEKLALLRKAVTDISEKIALPKVFHDKFNAMVPEKSKNKSGLYS